jgi:hypothetical protein
MRVGGAKTEPLEISDRKGDKLGDRKADVKITKLNLPPI